MNNRCPLLLNLEENATKMGNIENENGGCYKGSEPQELSDTTGVITCDTMQGDKVPMCQYCTNLQRALKERLRRQKVRKSHKHINVQYLSLAAIRRRLAESTKRKTKLSLQLSIPKAKLKVGDEIL